MKTLKLITIITFATLLLMGCASQSKNTRQDALAEQNVDLKISKLNSELYEAVDKNRKKDILMLLTVLSRTAFANEKMPEFKQYSNQLINVINDRKQRTTVEQQTLAYLGGMANNFKHVMVPASVKQVAHKICKPISAKEQTYATILVQAERKMANACHKLLQGNNNAATNLSLVGFELYNLALSQNTSIPGYVTTRVPGKSFLINVIENRYCQELEVFCKQGSYQ